jgi:hypothetical protein
MVLRRNPAMFSRFGQRAAAKPLQEEPADPY